MPTQKLKAAFLELLEQNKKIVFKVASMYTNNREDRADLIQEIIIQLWTSFERYDDTYKFSTWVYRIALNVSISHIRKDSKRKKTIVTEYDAFLNVKDEISSDNEQEQNIQKLYGFIGTLKPIDKAIILLYLEDKSHQEIAEIIGISTSNVGTRISRIKVKLQEKFKNDKN